MEVNMKKYPIAGILLALLSTVIISKDVFKRTKESPEWEKPKVPVATFVAEIKDKGSFDKLLKEKDDVVIKFFTTWCPACQIAAPHYNALAKEFMQRGKKITFVKINTQTPEGKRIAQEYEIEKIPTFVRIKKDTKKEVGFQDKTQLKKALGL